MKLADLVDTDLTALKLLLDSVPPFLRQRAADALARNDRDASEAYRRALGLELESLVLQLNATVDGLLLLLAARLKGKDLTASYTKESRNTWLTDLENHCGFKRGDLEGWEAVESTKSDSNLVKHRLGVSFAPGKDTPLTVEHVVDLTENTVLSRCSGVRQWLLALADRCKNLESAE